jgi:glycosyltransferase involved in cell wall biosynthesis
MTLAADRSASPIFSVVVSTIGRTDPLVRLFDSLAEQTLADLEVIVVDQNKDNRLQDLMAREKRFALAHLRAPDSPGACRGRNKGWRAATGRIVVFADDDCWYPPWLFEKAEAQMRGLQADILTGRSADSSGRSINARFETTAQRIDRDNAWTTAIEWMMFVRRGIIDEIGGFDEQIGPGAGTPWGAGEAQDLLLRAVAKGMACHFDPAIYGFHAEFDLSQLTPPMIERATGYGRGMGYVIRRHGYSPATLAYWLARPAAAVALYALRGDKLRSHYYANVVRGRLAGWRQKA